MFSTASASFAASAEVYGTNLNADESLALFGTSIPALYYTGAGVDTASFEYIGNTFAIKQDVLDLQNAGSLTPTYPVIDVGSSRGTLLYNDGGFVDDQNDGFYSADVVRATNFLIYRWESGAGVPPVAGNFDFQIQIDTSIGIDAQALAFGVAWSCSEGLNSRVAAASRSDLTLYNASGYPAGEIKDVIAVRPGRDSWSNYYWYGFWGVQMGSLTHGSPGIASPTLFSQGQPSCCACFCRAGSLDDGAESINFSGFRANLKNVSAKLLPTAGTVSNGKLVYDDYAPWSVYLLIQCPIVYGDYILPTPDDDTTLGDINENISDLVVSTDELRKILLRIETNQNDMLTVERAHTAQFIDIIDKLNKIYNRMAESGEISPELVDAQALTRYDSTDYFNAMQVGKPNASAIANFAAPIGAVSGVFSNLVSRAGVGAMAGVCVSLLVLQWVLKRGRGD